MMWTGIGQENGDLARNPNDDEEEKGKDHFAVILKEIELRCIELCRSFFRVRNDVPYDFADASSNQAEDNRSNHDLPKEPKTSPKESTQ